MNDSNKTRISFRSPWVDSIPYGWGQVKLGHISKIYSGGTPDKKIDEYWTNGTVPWLNSGSVNQGLITEISEFISEQALANSSARWVPAGSLVMALAGQGKTKGMVAQLGIDATCNQSMAAIVLDKDHPRYMMYWLSSNYRNIRGIASDDTRDGLNLTHLKNIQCPRPSISEQTAIAAYLDTETNRIDELIEDKRQLLNNLDQLFNSVITEAVTFGLDPNVHRRSEPKHSLFDFPSHWLRCGLIKKIENIVDYRGKTPEKTDSGVFLVTARNIAEGWIDYDASAEFIAESAYEEVMSRGKPEIGDVLFTTEAPLGKVASIDRTDIALAQRIIKFRADSEYLDNNFLKYWLMSGYMQDQLKTWSSGSTAEGIKASRLRRLQILVPPLHEQTAIVEFIEKKLAEVRGLKLHVENERACQKVCV